MRPRRSSKLEDYTGPRAPDGPPLGVQAWSLLNPVWRVPLDGALTWRPVSVSYAPGPPPGITALGYSWFEPRVPALADTAFYVTEGGPLDQRPLVDVELAPATLVASF